MEWWKSLKIVKKILQNINSWPQTSFLILSSSPCAGTAPGRGKRPLHGWVSRCALSMAELPLPGYMEHMYNLLFILSHLGCLFLLLRERSAENLRRITRTAQVKGDCRVKWLCCVWPSEHPCQHSCCWARPLPSAWGGKAAISPLFIGSSF